MKIKSIKPQHQKTVNKAVKHLLKHKELSETIKHLIKYKKLIEAKDAKTWRKYENFVIDFLPDSEIDNIEKNFPEIFDYVLTKRAIINGDWDIVE